MQCPKCKVGKLIPVVINDRLREAESSKCPICGVYYDSTIVYNQTNGKPLKLMEDSYIHIAKRACNCSRCQFDKDIIVAAGMVANLARKRKGE